MFAIAVAAFLQIANCLDERFLDHTGAFARAVPAAGAALEQAEYHTRVPLDPSHQWIAGARDGDRVCVTDGHVFGWADASSLTFAPLPPTSQSAWLGKWEFAESGDIPWIRITRRKDGKLHVSGYAEWRAHPDSDPHLGELDFTGLPRGIVFDEAGGSETDCAVRLMLLGDRLLAKDNGYCGGMNVNFTTVYKRMR